MGGFVSKISTRSKTRSKTRSVYSAEESQDSDYEVEDNYQTIVENGLLDIGSKSLNVEDFEQSMNDNKTIVGKRPIRKRSLTWPKSPDPLRTINRSFMCCTGNSISCHFSVN